MEEQNQQHEERIRSFSSSSTNRKVDWETIETICEYENKRPGEIEEQIKTLEKE